MQYKRIEHRSHTQTCVALCQHKYLAKINVFVYHNFQDKLNYEDGF